MRTASTPLLATLTLGALLLAGCGDDDGADDPQAPAAADLPEGVVVFTPEEVDDTLTTADWTPTADDVEAAESALEARLLASSADQGLDPLATYSRQYAGVDGDAVEVNALCTTDLGSFDWTEDWIVVNDGGPCYWQATVRDGEIEEFSVNGSA